eukprot:CAMPEP_0184690644 /NCGR_PEP_ID=MMETSP0312-20130426/31347_1 /TAXON_ID=31354 /ORGANISM="Compsopogon coeruleus, Strain SAG 36.94" /LENGTH=42 /DNA_ID= /DNA_START= /DNA_END= /DNA_ORIENTATION=
MEWDFEMAGESGRHVRAVLSRINIHPDWAICQDVVGFPGNFE